MPVILMIFLGGLLAGCGASSPYYEHGKDRPDRGSTLAKSERPQFTLFFIGDTGSPAADPLEPNLQVLRHHLGSAGKNSAVVFLGDNIYSYGLRPEGHPERKISERRIDTQLEMLEGYLGQPIFIPGNHDWNDDLHGGWEAIQRQQKYIENRLGPSAFTPDGGCPGPEDMPLDSTSVLLVLDTEWWLYPHEKPGITECENGSTERFVAAVDSLVQKYKDRNLFVAGHHPLHSNGKHGGYFPVTDHLFPLLDYSPVLYIPLPLIGSINPVYRKVIGYRQDLAANQYSKLKDQLVTVFRRHLRLVYAAGHDHSLQYHPIGRQHYIVSGGGTVQNYVRRGKSADFVYSHKGFAQIDIYADHVSLSFWTPEGESPRGRMVYENVLYRKKSLY